MKAFKCRSCQGVSYSSAPLKYQTHPECPYCGALSMEELEEPIRPAAASSCNFNIKEEMYGILSKSRFNLHKSER